MVRMGNLGVGEWSTYLQPVEALKSNESHKYFPQKKGLLSDMDCIDDSVIAHKLEFQIRDYKLPTVLVR